jgi:hypothetical protein
MRRLSIAVLLMAFFVYTENVGKNVTVSPGGVIPTGYPPFWDMWGTGWGMVTPSYAVEEKLVTAEIIV